MKKTWTNLDQYFICETKRTVGRAECFLRRPVILSLGYIKKGFYLPPFPLSRPSRLSSLALASESSLMQFSKLFAGAKPTKLSPLQNRKMKVVVVVEMGGGGGRISSNGL